MLTAMEVGISVVPFGAAALAFEEHGIASIEGWVNLAGDIAGTVLKPAVKVAQGVNKLRKLGAVGKALQKAAEVNLLTLAVGDPRVLKGIRLTRLVLANADLAFQGVIVGKAAINLQPNNDAAAAALALGVQIIAGIKSVKGAKKANHPAPQQKPAKDQDLPPTKRKGDDDGYEAVVGKSRAAHATVPKPLWDQARQLFARRVTSKGAKKQMDPDWVSTQTGDTTKNADILRRNLGAQAGDGMQAHHIVRGKGSDTEPARKLLEEYQIDINSADNGVLISESFHRSGKLHDPRVTDRILTRLKSKTRSGQQGTRDRMKSRAALIDELSAIGAEIIEGVFP